MNKLQGRLDSFGMTSVNQWCAVMICRGQYLAVDLYPPRNFFYLTVLQSLKVFNMTEDESLFFLKMICRPAPARQIHTHKCVHHIWPGTEGLSVPCRSLNMELSQQFLSAIRQTSCKTQSRKDDPGLMSQAQKANSGQILVNRVYAVQIFAILISNQACVLIELTLFDSKEPKKEIRSFLAFGSILVEFDVAF